MQLITGRTAQEYSQRKQRRGAYWEDRYHATAVDTDAETASSRPLRIQSRIELAKWTRRWHGASVRQHLKLEAWSFRATATNIRQGKKMSVERYHCPYRQSSLLQQALAPNKMRIAFLLGAGCPTSIRIPNADSTTSPLIPDIAGLTRLVNEALANDEELTADYSVLLARLADTNTPNIESILSHLRALVDVVRTGNIDGLNSNQLKALDSKICSLIANAVGAQLPESGTAYHHLAAWISGIARTHPIEVFTPNYDLLTEQALESRRVPYFDGFVGAREAFFDLPSMEDDGRLQELSATRLLN